MTYTHRSDAGTPTSTASTPAHEPTSGTLYFPPTFVQVQVQYSNGSYQTTPVALPGINISFGGNAPASEHAHALGLIPVHSARVHPGVDVVPLLIPARPTVLHIAKSVAKAQDVLSCDHGGSDAGDTDGHASAAMCEYCAQSKQLSTEESGQSATPHQGQESRQEHAGLGEERSERDCSPEA
ncbi:hypothetical protein K466DRAFT_262979 [Polyporus arcularius HHB13444]|uniref:Uncharacterized protein n=1 Tax=Polyporus arcularius HHB13444 TaxID=1314778 RepID=A0A5C3P371_9APHY|nr:hypothetical protein K466DRAFT_262979 [Polyporus arcularius HHB13444]